MSGYVDNLMETVRAKDPAQPEFHDRVRQAPDL